MSLNKRIDILLLW